MKNGFAFASKLFRASSMNRQSVGLEDLIFA
jgi:hypothetical protein